MKFNLFVFAILLLASLGFAVDEVDPEIVTACEQTCCEDAGGTWDGSVCSGADETYNDCVGDCIEAVSAFTENCCCGTALILLVAGAALFVKN